MKVRSDKESNNKVRENVIKRSLEMFMNKGCRAVTMDEIASMNGISKRTLYEMFCDKANLLESCIVFFENDMTKTNEQFRQSAANALEVVFKIHSCQEDVTLSPVINFFEEIKKFYPVIYNDCIQRFIEFHKRGIINILERGEKEGLIISSLDIELASRIILQMIHVIGDTDIFTRTNHARKELFKNAIIMYIRGIATEKGRVIIDQYLK